MDQIRRKNTIKRNLFPLMGAGICIGLYLAADLAEPELKLELFTVVAWA